MKRLPPSALLPVCGSVYNISSTRPSVRPSVEIIRNSSFVCLFIHLLIPLHSFLFTRLLIHSFTHSFVRLFVCLFACILVSFFPRSQFRLQRSPAIRHPPIRKIRAIAGFLCIGLFLYIPFC